MKKSRLTEERLACALKQVELGWRWVSEPQDGRRRGDVLRLAQVVRWTSPVRAQGSAVVRGGEPKLKQLVADLWPDKAMLHWWVTNEL